MRTRGRAQALAVVAGQHRGRAAGDSRPWRQRCGGVQKDEDVFGAERLATMQNTCAFDKVAELADIAGPAMLHEQRHRGIVIAAFGFGRHPALEMADQCRNVLDAVRKARDLDHDDAKTEKLLLGIKSEDV